MNGAITDIDSLKDIKYERKPTNELTDIYEYLDALKHYSFIISAKDEAYGGWNENLQRLLKNCGLNGGFQYRDSYIAVVENGQVVTELVSHEQLEYINGNICIKSAGFDTGVADSLISIKGKDYSAKKRGLNIVVLEHGKVIDSVAFDTSLRILPCIREQ